MRVFYFINIKFFSVLLILLSSFSLYAQKDSLQLSNWRTVNLKVANYPINSQLQLDSLSVLEETITIKNSKTNALIDTTYYKLENNTLLFKKTLKATPLTIRFRVLPFNLAQTQSLKDTNLIGLAIDDPNWKRYQYDPKTSASNFLPNNQLDYSGSYTRGLSFGNSQDLVLNSVFNLQLSGDLGDGVSINAAISDNNVPIQPQGNTQQLQEFDKLFIQIKKNQTSLIAGDYELRRPNSYFMNYFKKLQGLTIGTALRPNEDGGLLKTSASLAFTRGKFSRFTITAIEGNQGPYRLRGSNDEQFIIVLAGTEKVYIDGQLLIRGQDKDYVIDYNRGEVIFTTNQLITKDKRIVVEFEYNDQNYNRSLIASTTSYETDKLQLDFNFYTEQDSRTSSTQGQLTAAQRLALAQVGDDAGNTFASGVDSIGFNADRIMYKIIDTLVNGILYDSVVVYSTNEDSAIYNVRFSEVIGGGNYIRLQSAANGTVFGWIAPDPITGQPRGTYEPVVRLVAPAKRQLYTLGGTYKINKNSKINSEIALSNRDLNRLSALDATDNLGGAAYLNYENKKTLNVEKGIQLVTDVAYEFKSESFAPLNPYRAQEFSRNWNTNNLPASDEHLAQVNLSLAKSKLGSVRYGLSSFLKDTLYVGLQHLGVVQFRKKGFDILLQSSLLSTQGQKENSNFFKPKFQIKKTFEKKKNASISIYGEREQNKRNQIGRDTLSATSFYYDLVRGNLNIPISKNFTFDVNVSQRTDYVPLVQNFVQSTSANDINLNGRWTFTDSLRRNRSQLGWNLTYRNLDTDTTYTTQQAQETYLGRADYQMMLGKGLVRLQNNYQIQSGQEQKIQFNYVQVDAGQGVYSWIDRNADGIKQLDEFEIAAFQDQADHIRVTTFTDEFIRSNTVQLNQTLSINPKVLWFKEQKNIKKFVSRFATQSALQITRKVRVADNVSPWNPFELDVADTSLVAMTANIRNVLFFNQGNPKFSSELGLLNNRNRVVLTSGYESRGLNEQYIRFRWNINKSINLKLEGETGNKLNDSELFSSRDYNIVYVNFSPEASFTYKRTFRAQLKYQYSNGQNTIGEFLETALNHNISTTLTYNKLSKSSIRVLCSYVLVDFEGPNNTPVEFAMLNGLQNGQNYQWNLTYRRSITKNIEMNVSYEGRKNGIRDIVHVGRASVRAMF